jgi:hypothetical protein
LVIASMSLGLAPVSSIDPPVMPAAQAQLPASIRSGLDPANGEVRAADAIDLRAHRLQQVAQVDDFRLARGVEQLALPLGEDRGHDRVLGRADRYHREAVIAAAQPALGRARLHIARRQFDLRAERFERFQVQVDGPVADGAAARKRDGRFAHPRQHRAEHQDRRAHLAHHVVGRDGRGDVARFQRHLALGAVALLGPRHLGRHAQFVEEVTEAVDVGQPRQVAQRQFVRRQQGAGQQRQCAVLRARDRDDALEALAADDANGVHRRALAQRA